MRTELKNMQTVVLASLMTVLLPQVLAFGNQNIAGGCSSPVVHNGRVRARGRTRLVRFQCQLGYQLVGSRYATCRDGEWDVPLPVCARLGCRRLPPLEHGVALLEHDGAIVNFVCLPGYQLSGPSMLYCDGNSWNASSPACVDSRAPPATKCDFEAADWCGWRNDEFHDFDWRRFSKRTPSSFFNTGPSCDHTLGAGHAGHYLYVESTALSPNDKARLLSPLYAPSAAQDGCFRFYYHMFGKTTGELRVFVKPLTAELASVLATQPLWSRAGNQGDKWYRGVVRLPNLKEDFQIVVEGVRGSSFTSDIAIDDVALLSPQECTTLLAEDMTTTTPAATVASLDSCAGRCGSAALYSPRGDTYECSCSLVCLTDNSCCADFRDLCIFADAEKTSDDNDIQGSNADAGPQTERLVAASPSSVVHDTPTTPVTTTVATTQPSSTATTKITPSSSTAPTKTTPSVTTTVTTPSTTTTITTLPTTTLRTTTKPPITKTQPIATTGQPKTTAKPSSKASTANAPTTIKIVTTAKSRTTPPSVTTPSLPTTTITLKTTVITTNAPRSGTSSLVEKKDGANPTKTSHTSTGGAGQAAGTACAAVVALAAAAMAVVVWRRRRRQRRSSNDEVRYLTANDHCDVDAADDMIYIHS